MMARQAIMNGKQMVVGYELFNRAPALDHHTAASDVLLVFSALSHVGPEELLGKMLLFVNCTYESLSGGHLELVNPDKVVLEIPPLAQPSAQEVQAWLPILTSLRQRGFHLAFNHMVMETVYAPWLSLADYIKLDLSLLPLDQVAVFINYAKRQSKAELIAEKIETAQQYDMVSSLGVQLFQGYWFARPTLVQTKLVTPTQAGIVQLLNLLRKQASTGDIEEALKKDAGLTLNLLRLINSAGLGLRHEIASVRQAVMLLGLKKLFRWAALLLTAVRNGGTPPAVGQTAVVRGRHMELLALELMDQQDADQAFVVGVFSMLDQMLGMPLEQAVKLLDLPENMGGILLLREGVFGHLLTLVEACETGDDVAFAQSAQALKLSSQQINLSHLQALAWADQMGQE